jgi:hypothetical protein
VAWANTEALLSRLLVATTEAGAGFLVIMAPTGFQVLPDAAFRAEYAARLGVDDLYYPEKRLTGYAAGHDLPLFPLAPAMAEIAGKEQVVLHGFPNSAPGIGHWNANGQRLAAELLGPAVCHALRRQIGVDGPDGGAASSGGGGRETGKADN